MELPADVRDLLGEQKKNTHLVTRSVRNEAVGAKVKEKNTARERLRFFQHKTC